MQVSDEVREKMRATNERFCSEVATQGNVEAMADVYTAGARVLPPGAEMITGLPGIKAFWRAGLEAMGVMGAKLETLEAEMCGESVVEIGRATLKLETGQEAVVKYVVHWKEDAGTWKWDVDIWNSMAP